MSDAPRLNVEGGTLRPCAGETGYHRDGLCRTVAEDNGTHIVCARMTDIFLAFTRTRGNDLTAATGSFRGLRAGDRWCLCIMRWIEAYRAGVAPPVYLRSTDRHALDYPEFKEAITGAPILYGADNEPLVFVQGVTM